MSLLFRRTKIVGRVRKGVRTFRIRALAKPGVQRVEGAATPLGENLRKLYC